MGKVSDRRILLVTRQTRIDELVQRHNTLAQARFVIESQGLAFDDYLAEDQVFKQQLASLKSALDRLGRLHHIDRGLLPAYLFRDDDLVVCLGQDGLVANTLKYLDGQPLIAINPDPGRYDGVLLPFDVQEAPRIVLEVLRQGRPSRAITFGEARLNDGQRLLAVNDLFIGVRGHSSARYEIAVDGERERHSSSGIIVSTGLGSTGWLRSIVTGASRVAAALGQPLAEPHFESGVSWDSDFLFYSVREPFPSAQTGTRLSFGRVTAGSRLDIVSSMPTDGVIFSDGMGQDYLEFNSGRIASIGVADRRGRLVV